VIAKQPAVKRYIVALSGNERERLNALIQKGASPARQVLKARILLKADASEGGAAWSDGEIAEALDTSIDTIPSICPYLQLDEKAIDAAWRTHPRRANKLRVGLVWAGNPRFRGDQLRSTTLEALLPLAEVEDVDLFSLQFGPAVEQIAPLQSRFPLTDACSSSKDFAETAAFVATLDLVVSVDTAIAHLAGAMGLPVWVILPHLADWRWLEHRQDSPWYPTARLFRQPSPGDWKSVAEQLRDALCALRRSRQADDSDNSIQS